MINLPQKFYNERKKIYLLTFLGSLLMKKRVAWCMICLPIFIEFFLIKDLDPSIKRFWSTLLIATGFTALFFFIFVLLLHPFIVLFPKLQLLKLINRRRREWGVASFIYAFIHLLCYLGKKKFINGKIELKSFFHPVILTGLFAFLILTVLASTSNNVSIRKLGVQKWKKIHSLAYLASFFIFFHLALQKGWALFWAFTIFPILFSLQLIRKFRKT